MRLVLTMAWEDEAEGFEPSPSYVVLRGRGTADRWWKRGTKDKLVSNIPLSSPDGRHFPRNGLPVTGKVFFFCDKVHNSNI